MTAEPLAPTPDVVALQRAVAGRYALERELGRGGMGLVLLARDVARAAKSWQGKLVVDAMNAFGVPPDDLGGLPSTAAVAAAMPGATLVKVFNHLPASTLAEDPAAAGGRRVVFVSSDAAAASTRVAELVGRLCFAPVELGKVSEGGMVVQARGSTWGRLIFQDFIKLASK